NQTTKNAGPQEDNGDIGLKKRVDAKQSEEKNVSTQQYIVFPLWSSISSSYKSSDETYKNDTADDTAGETPVKKPASENEQALKNCNMELLQRKATKASNPNSFNTVSTLVNAASAPRTSNDARQSSVSLGGSFPLNVNDLPNDPLMPNLEDTVEPTKIAQALDDESWVEAIQEELHQFKIQKVWTPGDLPYGKKAIGTKIEAIRLFLAYASFMNFVMYQMDVKSVFLYGIIDEEVYISQPPSFVDPEFLNKVYKVEKALYGLHQAPRACVRTVSTPMETNKALTKDKDGEDVDVHLYRSMIGSLMYLTSSRPDIIFSVSFSDSDYLGASLDRKSTIEGCQFLGSRLISWQCKKQNVVANSTTEAEYIATSHCCGQNPVYHSKTKHIEIRHHFIRDSDDKRLIEMVKIHTDNNVADLLTKAFDGKLMVFKCSGVYTSAIWIEVGMDYNWWQSQAPRHHGGAPAQTRSERVLEKPNEPPLSEGHTSGSGEGRMEHQFELTANVPITPHDSPLPGGYTPGSDEGRLKLQELMTMCTKLSKQVLDLEKEKDVQAVEILRLKKRVKRLERQRKSSTSQPRRRKYRQVESSDDDLNEEDASKQGRSNDKTKQ
ncbi:putative ribonuclease H-like domain-containing protein, partial [Tanacetum coccineum]